MMVVVVVVAEARAGVEFGVKVLWNGLERCGRVCMCPCGRCVGPQGDEAAFFVSPIPRGSVRLGAARLGVEVRSGLEGSRL